MGDKLLLLATAIGLSCAIGSAAQAAPNHGWYVAAEIGANWTDASGKLAWGGMLGLTPHDSTLALADGTADLLTLGHVLNDRFALELEVGYRRSDIPNSADAAHQTTAMLNGIASVDLNERFSLQIGAGLGLDSVSTSTSDRQWSFAYQGIVGATLGLSDEIDLFLRLRYLSAPGLSIDDIYVSPGGYLDVDELSSTSATVGLRYRF